MPLTPHEDGRQFGEKRVIAITSPEHTEVDVFCNGQSFTTSKEALVYFCKSVLETPWMIKPEVK